MNGEIAGVELVVQKTLELAAKLVQSAMDLAPIEVESELVGRDQNPENPAVENAVEVAVPLFVDQLLLQRWVFERVYRRLVRQARSAADRWGGLFPAGTWCR
jgi:hypothetical protein